MRVPRNLVMRSSYAASPRLSRPHTAGLLRARWWSAEAKRHEHHEQRLGDCFFDNQNGGLREEHCCGKNEFIILGVPENIEVDLQKLDKNMRMLQRRLHPDLFAQASQEQQKRAERFSARVNTAYAIIRDPLLRANRAIGLKLGRSILSEEDKEHVDMDLLMSILETREAIEACDSEDELRQIFDDNDSSIWDTRREMADEYRTGDFEAAAASLVRLQYLTKIRKDIIQTSEKFGGALRYKSETIL